MYKDKHLKNEVRRLFVRYFFNGCHSSDFNVLKHIGLHINLKKILY